MISRKEINRLLERAGFRLFLECEEPRLDIYIRGAMVDDPAQQAIMLGTAKDGRTDVWLSLGTTLDTAHQEKLMDRLVAHLEAL